MERKANVEEEGERVQSSRVTINGNDEVSQKQEEGLSVLKREIACHSLYGHMIESHLECLKLCLGNVNNVDENVTFTPTPLQPLNHPNLFTSHQSELDQFMEAYCVALNQLKEVIEVPQQESMAFINYMYSQLEELLLSDIITPSSTIYEQKNGSQENAKQFD
ncbi:KNOX1 domain [Castilleja foliolosa]|uniref:KNOX1 domain n=1 Tax=Castilleja foliolosa TaxID=1961234 RepID=A0ABD3BKP4_9LAMI